MTRSRLMVAALAATIVLPGLLTFLATRDIDCAPFESNRLAILRVDGTDLTDWAGAPSLALLVQQGVAATVLAPAGVLETPSVDGTLTGTVVASSDDFSPLLGVRAQINGRRRDAGRPTGARLDLIVAGAALTRAGPVEIDVSDLSRIDHTYRASAARTAWTRDALETTVAPLVARALGTDRPVALLSLVPPVHRQHGEAEMGALVILTPETGQPAARVTRGAMDGTAGMPAGVVGRPSVRAIATAGVVCAAPRAEGGLGAATQAESIAEVRDGHLTVVIVSLGLGALAIFATLWLVGRARRGRWLRLGVGVIGTGMLVLPATAAVAGMLAPTDLASRIGLELAAFLLGALAVATMRPAPAIIATAALGLGAVGISVASAGDPAARSLLAAPLVAGLRDVALDPITLGIATAAMLLLTSTLADWYPTSRATVPLVLVLGAGLGIAIGHPSLGAAPWHGALLAAAASPMWARLASSRATRRVVMAGHLVSALAVAALIDGSPAIARGDFPAQPRLWFLLLATLVAVAISTAAELTRHRDRFARASFGQPALRIAVTSTLPCLGAGLLLLTPQGTAAVTAAVVATLAGAATLTARR